MVRMTALNDAMRNGLEGLECPVFEDKPWADNGPLSGRKVALISSAGLIQKGDPAFRGGDAGYRTFSDAVADDQIVVSHISVNFDRTVASRDLQAIFPRRILSEIATDGTIGSVSTSHYSFMGATDPVMMEDEANGLAGWLKADGVDSVVFLPV